MRLFVAAEVTDEAALAAFSNLQQRMLAAGVKGSAAKHFHFTLQFLGDVPDERVDAVKAALSSIRFPLFEIFYEGVGAFPDAHNPRIIWAGVDKKSSLGLRQLAALVAEKLQPLGIKQDKQFVPHVTLLRVKSGSAVLEPHSFGREKVTAIKLKQSTLTPEGPVYEDVLVVRAQS